MSFQKWKQKLVAVIEMLPIIQFETFSYCVSKSQTKVPFWVGIVSVSKVDWSEKLFFGCDFEPFILRNFLSVHNFFHGILNTIYRSNDVNLLHSSFCVFQKAILNGFYIAICQCQPIIRHIQNQANRIWAIETLFTNSKAFLESDSLIITD